MNLTPLSVAILAVALGGLLPTAGARAQWYSSYPQAHERAADDVPGSVRHRYVSESAPDRGLFQPRRDARSSEAAADDRRIEPRRLAKSRRVGEARTKSAPRRRVMHAEAEITVLGPDSISIRLYRKGGGRGAKLVPGE